MKKKKENENTSRVYLKSWEQKFPWIRRGQGPNGEERAFCTWCQKDLDVHSSGLRKHELSSKHKELAKTMAAGGSGGSQQQTSEVEPPSSEEPDAVNEDMAKDLTVMRDTALNLTNNLVTNNDSESQRNVLLKKDILRPHLEPVVIPTVFDLPDAETGSHILTTVDTPHTFLEVTKSSEQVVMGEDLTVPCSISVSLPVTGDLLKGVGDPVTGDLLKGVPVTEDLLKSVPLSGDLLKGVEVLAEAGDSITLDNVSVIQTELKLPVIPMCKLNANAQQCIWYQEQLREALQSGEDYDLIWHCDGATFRAHKLILAAFSDHMASVLPCDDSTASISTPDLSADMVKAILCLMYTGQINVTWKLLQDINYAFKLIGFCGKDLTASPNQTAHAEDDSVNANIVITYTNELPDNTRILDNQEFTNIKFTEALTGCTTPGKISSVLLTSSVFSSHNAALLTPAQLEDQGFIFDDADNFIIPDPPEIDIEDYKDIDHKQPIKIPQQHKAIKIELEDEEENIEPKPKKLRIDKEVTLEENSPKSVQKNAPKTRSEAKAFKKDLDVLFNKAVITNDNEVTRFDDDDNKKRIRTDKESQVTYAVCRKDKGVLSRNLAFSLFDNESFAANVKIITVCPICFKVFDDRDKMKDHKIAFHNADVKGVPTQNSMILGKNKFKCRKCEEVLELKHLVWFVKHYKFCGIDDVKANEVLRVNDVEERVFKPVYEKKNSRDMDFLYVLDKPKLKEMSRFLLGKIYDAIWGCRKCYQPFDCEEALTNHINSAHRGTIEHGTSYDPDTKMYTCMNCKVYKTNKSVIYYIYHLSRCNVQAQGIIPIDDEEDVDGDTNDDFVDPWGVVFKPLKVISDRSKWICESLFGEVYSILYPCHICYSVYKLEEELREHFRISHPGLQNYPEHGSQYDGEDGGFNCPVCKRNVCKKQKSSIYFAYHMQKCIGKTLPVTRKCNDCEKSFGVFSSYQYHVQTKCGTTDFVCHICGIVLKNFNGLRCHVMYAHSEYRPYPCNVCNKAFKRAPDLAHHMKLHMGSLDWSCEKCGKAFPVKKALKNHMKIHYTEAEKPHVCHICGNRFAYRKFLTNHMTTHSSFRGFECEVCNSKVKTRDTLKLHRKKVHKLFTPIPNCCVLQQDPIQPLDPSAVAVMKKNQPQLLATVVTNPLHIKEEEVLPMLGEELELT